MIWFFLYNVFVLPSFWLLVHLVSLFNEKVRRGIDGRKLLFANLANSVEKLPPGHKRVWFHASSLGEFESAKPIIAACRKRYPPIEIIVSFFSPSGYEHSKSYKLASVITYLPFDSRANARRFIDLIRPDLAIVVRYDLWPNHIWQLKAKRVPIFIANVTLSEDSTQRFPLVRGLHRTLYSMLDGIFTVSSSDHERFVGLFRLDHPQVEVIGDTRYDQVWMRSQEAKEYHVIPDAVVRRKRILVIGSSWEHDEEVILPVVFKLQKEEKNLLTVLVPHEPTLENLDRVEAVLNGQTTVIRFSNLNDYDGEKTILVDSVGVLLSLYAYADVAIVGGGFHQGVHNVLEPAVFGIPVLFGPKHTNSREAILLVERGGGIAVENQRDLFRRLRSLLEHEKKRKEVGKRAQQLVKDNLGGTERILRHLEPYLSSAS
ncbi:MAG: 3-deoxy-D-manno-octulosonic acid transferase [Bacteroidota bacterium]